MKKDLRVYADDIDTVQQIEKVRRSAQEMQICCIAYTDKIQYHRYIKKNTDIRMQYTIQYSR